MTETQFEQLVTVLNNSNNDIPTWLSLIFGAALSIFGSIIFDWYKNYRNRKEILAQIKNVEIRLINYLDRLIPDSENAYIDKDLVLEVNQKIENNLIQLIDLKRSINSNTKYLNKVLINTIYIKQYVSLERLTGNNNLSSNMLSSTKIKAIEIKNAVEKNEGVNK